MLPALVAGGVDVHELRCLPLAPLAPFAATLLAVSPSRSRMRLEHVVTGPESFTRSVSHDLRGPPGGRGGTRTLAPFPHDRCRRRMRTRLRAMRIDFVSDIACPWCAVGLHSLEAALARLGDAIPVELHLQPFELNPTLPPEGDDTVAYLSRKYGIGPEQIARNQATLRERGAAVGFTFGERARVWNTFDAHRLLAFAAAEGPAGAARALKHALLHAYHGEGRNPGAPEVLRELAVRVGLDARRADEVIAGDDYAAQVREAEQRWQQAGIHAVPSVVIDGRHLIQGGQPPEVFEQALRQIAAAPAAA